MLALIRNMRVRTRIALILILPVSCMLWLSGVSLLDQIRIRSTAETASGLIALATDTGRLVQELQRERGLSAALLAGAEPAKTAEALAQQRAKGDVAAQAALARFDRFDEMLAHRPAAARQAVAQLGGWRRRLDGASLGQAEAHAVYTQAIDTLLNVVRAIPGQADDARVLRALGPLIGLMEVRELAGQERAIGVPGFARGAFTPDEARRLSALAAVQEADLAALTAGADGERAAILAAGQENPASASVAALRQVAEASVASRSAAGHGFAEWFSATTARIDHLRRIEERLASHALTLAGAIASAASRELLILVAFDAVLLAITAIALVVVVHGITSPLADLTQAMRRLAGGDTNFDVDGIAARDELGEMSRALAVFRTNALAMAELKAQQERDRLQAEEDKRRMTRATADEFEGKVKGVVASVSSASQHLETTAQALARLADQAARQSTVVAAASEEAAANVQTVAAAADELAASVGEITRQVTESASFAGHAVREAENAETVIHQLFEAGQRIGEVVCMITEIASQTNLLALNATIEAARAGEAGKGFAVVANEVKSLANQTAKATGDIAAQVEGVQKSAQNAAQAIESIGSTIRRISEISSAIASAVEEQGSATAEIARNVEQTAVGTQDVSGNIVGVRQAVGETGTSAADVLASARHLAEQSRNLENEVTHFIRGIRAA